MHNRLAIAYIESPIGELGLAAGEHGLIALTFSTPLDRLLPGLLKQRRDQGRGRLKPWDVLEQACHEVAEYMMNAREKFETPLDLSTGTEFQRTVWRRLQRVAFGKPTTYQELAAAVGRPAAARAIGNAVGSNPLPILIPCHRVLAAGRNLGGFSGGLKVKKQLLAIEGIEYK